MVTHKITSILYDKSYLANKSGNFSCVHNCVPMRTRSCPIDIPILAPKKFNFNTVDSFNHSLKMGKIIRPNHIVFVIKLLSYLDKYFCSSNTARRVKKYFDKHSHKICSEVRINKKHEPSTVTNYNGS